MAKKPRKGGEPAAPVTAKELSLPPANYTGSYTNEHWGTPRIKNKGGTLAATFGDLPVLVKSTGIDAFQIRTDERSWLPSRFMPEAGRVAAIVVRIEGLGGDVRFEQKGK